jgi:hypothetical protein
MNKFILSVLSGLFAVSTLNAQYQFDNILYGAAYYHEYRKACLNLPGWRTGTRKYLPNLAMTRCEYVCDDRVLSSRDGEGAIKKAFKKYKTHKPRGKKILLERLMT